jgi:DMSO reductase anchor subunit
MKPALSIIFFTVSSGAGLGLLALVALVDALAGDALAPQALWRGALLGLLLVAAGLTSSLVHLANPKNAWRAFSRFRSSWLSREAVFAAGLFPIAALYILRLADGRGGSGRALLAIVTVALAWAVLACTAMIYASLKPIRQWHTRWTPANYFLLGHWSGALLLCAVASAYATAPAPLLVLAGALGLASLAAKLAYWYAIGRGAPTTLARAIGVEQGVRGPGAPSVARARLLDVGHSRGTFLTDEFGFALAREHGTMLRALALVLTFGVPLPWLVAGMLHWQLALVPAACCIIGLLVERWLFFAEAKHTVRLYHGEPRT